MGFNPSHLSDGAAKPWPAIGPAFKSAGKVCRLRIHIFRGRTNEYIAAPERARDIGCCINQLAAYSLTAQPLGHIHMIDINTAQAIDDLRQW